MTETILAPVSAAMRYAIESMQYAVARSLDDDRLEAFPDYFTANGRYRVASRFNVERGLPMAHIYCTSRAMIADRILSLRRANIYEKHRYRHLVSGIHISAGEDGEYESRSSYLVIRIMEDGTSTLFSSGEYQDRIVIEDGTPKFRSRDVTFDSKSIETLLVIPL